MQENKQAYVCRVVYIASLIAILTLSTGCGAGPITLGLTAAGDAVFGLFGFGSLTKSHADDTFLIGKEPVLEATYHALDVMTLSIDETKEDDNATIITGSSAAKAPMKFIASVRQVSSTVTNVSIRAGRGVLKPDHSTAEEIMNQIILRLEQTTAASTSSERANTLPLASTASPSPVRPTIETTPAAIPVAPKPTRPLPYVIQIASYRDKDNADQHVRDLREKGSQAYAVSFDIPDKGRWYRVLMQRFATKDGARKFAENIMANGVVDLAFPVALPFAVEVGTENNLSDAAKVEQRLKGGGFSSYVLSVRDGGTAARRYRILVGAYESQHAAATVSQQLLAARIPSQIVTP